MGTPTGQAVAAVDAMRADGLDVGLAHIATPDRIDASSLAEIARQPFVVTVEDHSVNTGSALAWRRPSSITEVPCPICESVSRTTHPAGLLQRFTATADSMRTRFAKRSRPSHWPGSKQALSSKGLTKAPPSCTGLQAFVSALVCINKLNTIAVAGYSRVQRPSPTDALPHPVTGDP